MRHNKTIKIFLLYLPVITREHLPCPKHLHEVPRCRADLKKKRNKLIKGEERQGEIDFIFVFYLARTLAMTSVSGHMTSAHFERFHKRLPKVVRCFWQVVVSSLVTAVRVSRYEWVDERMSEWMTPSLRMNEKRDIWLRGKVSRSSILLHCIVSVYFEEHSHMSAEKNRDLEVSPMAMGRVMYQWSKRGDNPCDYGRLVTAEGYVDSATVRNKFPRVIARHNRHGHSEWSAPLPYTPRHDNERGLDDRMVRRVSKSVEVYNHRCNKLRNVLDAFAVITSRNSRLRMVVKYIDACVNREL